MQYFNPDRSNISQNSSHRSRSLFIYSHPPPHLPSPQPQPQPSSPPPPQQQQQQPQPQSSPTPMSSPTSKPNTKVLSFLLKAIIMALFISLFFIFVGIAALLLLHLCVAGRALRRHRRLRRSTLPPDSPSGLSPKDLQKLPCFNYSGGVGPAALADCAICLEGFRDSETCRVLPDCSHVFHVCCVDEWLVKVPACPICRSAVTGVVRSGWEIQNTEEGVSVRSV
ncbi:RING-H2 finger protein ATL56-like [Magnolia sinica]|uniref:RING-H2 finger protein ATL56-like n=1 Tax=Magnolia sinica TaxID=86752 RepID=UPI0026595BAC|nr:RING-H2 finger protein ATL56-like [Magnolia sinica]XP_058113889.1 RING-H2 finger protein ATL56-like [Magnolia sinica]